MSFYGDVINYLTKAFKSIKIGNKKFEAQSFEDEADLTDILDNRYNISIKEKDDKTDNKLVYELIQNDKPMGEINIPLDLILEEAEVKDFEEGDWGPAGTYIHLIFRTKEEGQKDVYINVTELNEIAGEDTDTIEVSVENNKIKANLLPSIKALLGYIDTGKKITEYIDEKIPLDTNTITTIAPGSGIIIEEQSTDNRVHYIISSTGGGGEAGGLNEKEIQEYIDNNSALMVSDDEDGNVVLSWGNKNITKMEEN